MVDQHGHHLFHGPGATYTQWGQTVDGTAAWQQALEKYGPNIFSTDDGRIVRNIGTESDPYYQDVGMLPHAQRPRGFMDFLLDNGPLLAGGAVVGGAALAAGGAGGVAPGAAASSAGGAGAAGGGGAAAAGTSSLFGVSAGDLFKGGTALFGNLFGAWMQGKAADKAAAAEADAARYAAGLQSQAQAQALQFQRESAENAFQNSEASRRGNYDQWAASQRRLGFIGEEVGLGPREIPAYVPGVDPRYTGGAPGTVGAVANTDLSGARATFDRLFPGDTLTPEMLAAKRQELEAAGFTLNPNAQGRITDLSYQGVNIDPIEGAGSGLNRKQFLVQPGGAPAAAVSSTPTRSPYVAPSVPFLGSTPVAPSLGFLGAY